MIICLNCRGAVLLRLFVGGAHYFSSLFIDVCTRVYIELAEFLPRLPVVFFYTSFKWTESRRRKLRRWLKRLQPESQWSNPGTMDHHLKDEVDPIVLSQFHLNHFTNSFYFLILFLEMRLWIVISLKTIMITGLF